MSFASRVWRWPLLLAGSFTLGVACVVAVGDTFPALRLCGEGLIAIGAVAIPVVFARGWSLRRFLRREQSQTNGRPSSP